MKRDNSKLVALVALAMLVVAITQLYSGLPSVAAIGETVLWIFGGILIFQVVRGRCGCGVCGTASEEES